MSFRVKINSRDRRLLDGQRIVRLFEVIMNEFGDPSLAIALSMDRRLLLTGSRELIRRLLRQKEWFLEQAWIIAAIEHLSVCAGDRPVFEYRRPLPKSLPENETNETTQGVHSKLGESSKSSEPMPKTLERNSTAPAPVHFFQHENGLPVIPIQSLQQVAENAKLTPEAIAAEMIELNLAVYQDGDQLKSSRQDLEIWADQHIAKKRSEERNSLLGVSNEPIAPAPDAPKKTRGRPRKAAIEPTQATRQASTRQERFSRQFKKSNSYRTTLGSFLTAQSWTEAKRIEVVEQLGQLPQAIQDATQDATVLPERIMAAILRAYPKADHIKARAGIIAAAREMQGLN